ncbi:MAG TPA: SDR family NAD(P)-dependent oxidoreductase [Acidimicrobiales bacterium]|jgi:NAD(P)-dependent dehydrogenase (short-subunit alcohol dehydrogenase family)|nr:SDR family NAD(P)-dependent oxidoreductase [Acidimicrobiales bacterium]
MSPIKNLGGPDPDRGTAAEYLSPGRFAGKAALVTGAGSGIGRATARRLAAEGAAVACLDIAEDAVKTVVDEIAEATAAAPEWAPGGRAMAVRCDVTDEDSVNEAVERATAELGPITAVCNVAGVGRFAHTVDQTLDGWQKILAVNLTGTFLVTRATLPNLLAHGGSITNVVSTTGVMGQAYSAAYSASKGGVGMMIKALAVEYVDKGVRVNGVAPGGVDTPLVWEFGLPEGADPKQLERMMTPMGFCSPAEVAAAIAYLASDEAGYISGSILSIDGALSA